MFYNLTDEAKMMEERQNDVYGEGLKNAKT